MRQYSRIIADVVKEYLDKDNWKYQFLEDDGLITFNLRIRGMLQKAEYLFIFNDDNYTVYASAPLSADINNPEIWELICRMNHGLKEGNFEVNPENGEIKYKMHIDCSETELPTKRMIERSIFIPQMMFARYGNGILQVMFNNETAKTAVEKSEADFAPDLFEIIRKIDGKRRADSEIISEQSGEEGFLG